jgi:hypothetical protein
MRRLPLLALAFFSLLLSDCRKKELIIPSIDIPDFYLRGTKDGQTFELVAGDADYYMFTSFEKDDSSVFAYQGTFAKDNCQRPTCAGALTIILRGAAQAKGETALPIENELQTKKYFYNQRDPKPLKQVSFSAEPSMAATGTTRYSWLFGDGQKAEGQNPDVLFSHTVNRAVVCLKLESSSCNTELCYEALLGICNAEITVEQAGNSYFLEAAYIGNSAPLSYSWIFEDNKRVTGRSIAYVPETGKQKERICLEIEDESGCMARICQEVILMPGVTCAAGYNYRTTLLQPVFGMLQLLTAEVIYTAQDGEVFSTALGIGSTDDFLEITGIEDYTSNENGYKVKRLDVRLNATLTSSQGAKIRFGNLEGKVGVAFN